MQVCPSSFIPSGSISSPRCRRTTACCRQPYLLPNHTFLLDNMPNVAAHAERNCACVSHKDQGRLAQYGCDWAQEEARLGRELVQPASLSLRHPVIQNSTDMVGKGITQQFISLLRRDGQGSNNVSQSDLAVSELRWQRIVIGLVPALHAKLVDTPFLITECPPVLHVMHVNMCKCM